MKTIAMNASRKRLVKAAREVVATELTDEPEVILIMTAGRAMLHLDVQTVALESFVGADGPGANSLFWWKGKSVRLRPREWKLVAFLWAKRAAEVADVRRAVWGDATMSDSTVRVAIFVANAALAGIACPLILATVGGLVKLE